MNRKGLSQEGLKLIACFSMLLDHVAAALFVPLFNMFPSGIVWYGNTWLRIVGRIAFPVYCFQLAEGIQHTKNPKKYALRLAVGALLAEIPFDLLFFKELTWAYSSVMVTLLLGFLYGCLSKKLENPWWNLLLLAAAFLAAEALGADYGGLGVALIALFILTREQPHCRLMQTVGLAVICWLLGGATVTVGFVRLPMQMFALFSLVPIFCYSGKKRTVSPWVQWGFYLFYPVHLALLLLCCCFLTGAVR